MLNVNQQMIVPRAPFDEYWARLTPEQESSPSVSRTISPILAQLGAKQVERIEVSISLFFLAAFLNQWGPVLHGSGSLSSTP